MGDVEAPGQHGLMYVQVVPLENFDVIFGIEFMRVARVLLMPCVGKLMICKEKTHYTVPVIYGESLETSRRQKSILWAKRQSRCGKSGHKAYLATLSKVRLETDVGALNGGAREGLAEGMPGESPKGLPPPSLIDRGINVGLRSSYRGPALHLMVPPELAQLDMHLVGQSEAGTSQPSQAPCSTPLLV